MNTDHVPEPPPMTDFGKPVAIIKKIGRRYYIDIEHGIGYASVPGAFRTLEQAQRKATQALAEYRAELERKPETWVIE